MHLNLDIICFSRRLPIITKRACNWSHSDAKGQKKESCILFLSPPLKKEIQRNEMDSSDTASVDTAPKGKISTACKSNNRVLVFLVLALCLSVSTREIFSLIPNNNPDSITAAALNVRKERVKDLERKNDLFNADDDDDSLAQICHRLADANYSQIGLPSVGTIWTSDISLIKQALLHSPSNEPFGSSSKELNSLIERVFQALPLSSLRRSVRPATLVSDDIKLRRILDVLWKRYRDAANNPPLQVLVFGGSPTAGSNCERNGKVKKQGQCAWPGHLQGFVNAYLGFDAIRVVNYAIGASSSHLATMMLQLRLFPLSMVPEGPDIVVNAYAVNDFSYHSGEQKDGTLSFQNLFSAFLGAIRDLTSCSQDRPFVIFLDDFSVNFLKGHSVEAVESYRAEISKLTRYHQVLTISFVDMIQDFLFRDSEEEKLFVDWRGDGKHIPWGGHVAIVLAFTFNALQIVVNLCERRLESTLPDKDSSTKGGNQLFDSYFRPHLDKKVALDVFGKEWSDHLAASFENCNVDDRTKGCPFGWIALRKEDEHRHIEGLESILVKSDNWAYVQTWPPTNYGLYGSRNGTAVLHLDSSATNATVTTITIIYMKSYSEKWYNSTVEATVHRCDEVVSSVVLSGFHEKLTSEFFTETITLPTGSSDCYSTNLTLQMTGGDTFRIGGLSFC